MKTTKPEYRTIKTAPKEGSVKRSEIRRAVKIVSSNRKNSLCNLKSIFQDENCFLSPGGYTNRSTIRALSVKQIIGSLVLIIGILSLCSCATDGIGNIGYIQTGIYQPGPAIIIQPVQPLQTTTIVYQQNGTTTIATTNN